VSPLPRVSKPIEPTTGRKETHTTSRSAALNRSTDLSPWPCRQLACLRAHAYTDTNEEPTTRHSSSKIGHPTTQSPSGTRMEARTAFARTQINAPPRPFNPGRQRGVGGPPCTQERVQGPTDSVQEGAPGAGGVGRGLGAGSFRLIQNGLAVSLGAGRQPVTGLALTCCRSRSRTPQAARPRPSPDRTHSRPDRCRYPAGRPRTWHPRSARPGCSGTRACPCRPG
jgi:hypothetical protein